ncbi:50S ribosomal protein L25 [Leucobacter aridicollis]|uniref:Large ribosomal subunit protein bL25 n=1 Tax=Leucobacter aridicollis TaxID=283878 RepID=A0A852QYF4_9MICO|nr:50S ribosomal protein L25/general stress protein Ctc [Leucobacter aridicollis]MBL3681524.1 50S ribosomal protein L25/general stress protein Ctc [Leucobacter aridicollis]MCS3427728.1 large subunit ribosomal protein L25 [Leucobacter aridicollis]NYD27443.1 large subunit ribosomal protein L25 [Leucobacter aridicollis]RKQ95004.1 large subunit ribosomal protein L25 [Mycolicibacterium mucogenicum 261Sha1.1M5]
MSVENKLEATTREQFGKGAARKLRAAGKTPAVVYGHGTDPKHVTVETHPLSLIVRYANPLVEITLDGKQELVLVKDVQKDPVRQIIEHVDMIIVKKGEKVEAEVPVHVAGTSFSGTVALQELNTLRLLVPATAIPESVQVDVEGAEEGTQVLAGDLTLPKGAELLDDAAQLVVQVVVPRGAAADDEAAEGAEEAAAE